MESRFLNDCPADFKPLYYKRYVDDTFVIFREASHANLFLNYINSQHNNIKFTIESEQNNAIPFLDVYVSKQEISHNNSCNVTFSTSIYRKPSFSGLGTSFFSFTPLLYKINAIRTLLFRAYNLSSTYTQIIQEVEFLKSFFISNGFPRFLIENRVRSFFNKIFEHKLPTCTVPKNKIFIKFPFHGSPSYKLSHQFRAIISKYFPQINFNIVFENKFTIKSLVSRWKEPLPLPLRTNFIYKFQCNVCNDIYIGCSGGSAWVRFSEHLGVSYRTGLHLASPPHSAPRAHSQSTDHPFSRNDFTILDYAPSSSNDIRILESKYIHRNRPKLNDMNSSIPLLIIN